MVNRTIFCKSGRSTIATHTHTRLTAFFPGLLGSAGTRKVKPIWFYWSKRQWEAVASAGPYASLHLAPDRYHASTSPLKFFYRPDALPAAQPTVSKHWRHLKHWRHKEFNHVQVCCALIYLLKENCREKSAMAVTGYVIVLLFCTELPVPDFAGNSLLPSPTCNSPWFEATEFADRQPWSHQACRLWSGTGVMCAS